MRILNPSSSQKAGTNNPPKTLRNVLRPESTITAPFNSADSDYYAYLLNSSHGCSDYLVRKALESAFLNIVPSMAGSVSKILGLLETIRSGLAVYPSNNSEDKHLLETLQTSWVSISKVLTTRFTLATFLNRMTLAFRPNSPNFSTNRG